MLMPWRYPGGVPDKRRRSSSPRARSSVQPPPQPEAEPQPREQRPDAGDRDDRRRRTEEEVGDEQHGAVHREREGDEAADELARPDLDDVRAIVLLEGDAVV